MTRADLRAGAARARGDRRAARARRRALDEAIALWERGEELYRFCLERLDAAQGRVEELAQRVEAQKPA